MGENVEGLSLMDAARKSVDAVRKLMVNINIPLHFNEVIDIDEETIPVMAKEAHKSGNNLVNPWRLSLEGYDSDSTELVITLKYFKFLFKEMLASR